MTRDDILRWAKEADRHADKLTNIEDSTLTPEWHRLRDTKFAELVAAAEREACARINDVKAERLAQEAEDAARESDTDTVTANRASALLLTVCAAAIRARKDSA